MNRVLKRAADELGFKHQAIIAIEEMSELTKELTKNIRGKKNSYEIAEEIADVEIMLDQIKYICDNQDYVDLWKERKIDRIKERLDEESML